MIPEAFAIMREGFAASADSTASVSTWSMDRAANSVTVGGFILGGMALLGKGVYWLLGRIFTDALYSEMKDIRSEVRSVRQLIDERWANHDETIRMGKDMLDKRIDALHDELRAVELGCASRHPHR